MSDFDPAHYSLQTHYTREARQIIQRLILEDWKSSEAKLPTYMKGVARAIIPAGVPDEWLSKLSHQTMSKMLKGTSIPRYAFWACLHLYLMKKYGDIGLTHQGIHKIDLLGQALARFNNQAKTQHITGTFALDDITAISLQKDKGFTRLTAITKHISDEPFSEPAYTTYQGAALQQDDHLTGLLNNVTDQRLKPLETMLSDIQPLEDPVLKMRLERLAGEA